MYKAIFLDLDGTLLDDNKIISKENYDAIEAVTKNNGFVILSSGRPISATQKYWEQVKASRYFIYSNGAGIYDTQNKETIFSAPINKNVVLELFYYCIEKEICIRLDTKYGRYLTNMDYATSTDIYFEDDINKFLNDDEVIQISFLSNTDEKIDNAINDIKNKFNSFIKIENHYTFLNKKEQLIHTINIVNTCTSKGNAISGLCKFLNINLSETIAMGDDLNDISMLTTVGLGVAMGNAKEEVKNVAKQITIDNNNSAVAKIINENFKFN